MSMTSRGSRTDDWPRRLLGMFTEVRQGESGTALLLMLNLFLLLTAYYMLKTVREPLILMGGGAEVKSYTAAAQALLLLGVIPLYSQLVVKMDRVRLINRITAFFMSNLALFYVLARLKVPYLGVAFFIWVGIFSLMIIAQAWSFANDIYDSGQGKRLFPLVAMGSTSGAVFGSWLAGRFYDLGIGSFEMMLISALLLGGCLIITNLVSRRERSALERDDEQDATPDTDDSANTRDGLRLVMRDRYLLLIGLMMLMANLVNTNGEFILGNTVEGIARSTHGDTPDAVRMIGSFYSGFFTWVNALTALLQFFAVSRVIKYAGVAKALFVLPIIALGGYALMATTAVLGAIRVAKIFENSTDYSLQNTTRHALFLPTSRDAKYQGKQAIDSFFMRAGDVLSAGVVFLGGLLGFATRHFAFTNIGLIAVWLVLAAAIGRRYRTLTEDAS
jgi:ATP:ADP antiporter, AAA family